MTQTIINLGTGGAVLNGRNGSTSSADSNDALYLAWPGANGGNYLRPGDGTTTGFIPDAANLDITGDIDLRAYVRLDSWTPTASQWLIGKRAGGANRSYGFGLLSTAPAGRIFFNYSTDGTAELSRVSSVATGLADGSAKWVRATLDADNGASGHTVKFFLSDDGVTWTQLGTDVVTAGTVTMFNSATNVGFGGQGTGGNIVGDFYRGQVFDGIEGTLVADVDASVITSGSQRSFTALTGQTVTIGNTGATATKAVCVVTPIWRFSTDDYMEVPDNTLLNFEASQPFTMIAVHRRWATIQANAAIIAKKANTTGTTQGWLVGNDGTTAGQVRTQVGDGTNGVAANTATITAGVLAVSAVVRGGGTLTPYFNGAAGTPVTDTTGNLTNAEVVRIGRLSGAGTGYNNMELIAVAVFRRALSSNEIQVISDYFGRRLS